MTRIIQAKTGPVSVICLTAALGTCIGTAAAALPVTAPAEPESSFESLLESMRTGDLVSASTDAVGETRGFRAEVDDPVRRVEMTAARASNVDGMIVGDIPADGGSHAMVWLADGTPVDIGDLPGGNVAGVARSINADGQVVGQGSTDEGERAFIWTAVDGLRDLNGMIDAEPGVVLLDATDIDDNGRIVGRASVAGIEQAFIWTPDTATLDFAKAPRSAQERIVDLHAIQTDGPAVGRGLSADGRDRPISLYPGTAATDLGDLPGGDETGVAYDVDSLGWIVGRSAAEDGDRAFVWAADSGMIDLNDLVSPPSDIILTAAVSIIEDGRILAYGRDGDTVHFYRMIPVSGTSDIRPGLVAEKGVADLQSYAITDLGAFTDVTNFAPILAMDETGRVVGACDLVSTACPYITDLDLVTNRFDDNPLLGPIVSTGGVPPDLVAQLTPPRGGGTQLTPRPPVPVTPFTPPRIPIGGNPTPDPETTPIGNVPPAAVVPVPASWFSLIAAFGLLGLMKRRRRTA